MAPYFIYFLSGFAALLYQVVWQRMLVLFSGADVYSITVIVSAFMAGLGLGSVAGGRIADRLGPARSLRAFAAVEGAIAICALLSKPLYYDVLYTRTPQLGANPAVAAIVLFASLLAPTFLMGMSLPLIARAITARIGAAGRSIGSLYGWNTVGAACGALITTWALVPTLGFDRALLAGATINLACAAAAIAMARRPPVESSDAAVAEPGPAATSLPFAVWVLTYGLTGFIALGLEVAWFRMLGVMMKSTSVTFGTVLTVYLAGIGLGGATGARAVNRSREPGRTFLFAQYAMVWYVAVSITLLVAALGTGRLSSLATYLGQYEPYQAHSIIWTLQHMRLSDPATLQPAVRFLLLYGVLPLVLIGPPTFLMGFSFPFLQRACQSQIATMGRRLGALLAANITGSVIGTTATGFLLLPRLGAAATLKMLVLMTMALAWPMWRLAPGRVAVPIVAVALTAAGAAMMPDGQTLWARLHTEQPRRVLVAEDGSGLSVLKQSGTQTAVFVNGLGQSWIPYGGIHTVLGALPTLIHPNPQRIVIVGLGSGDTAFSAVARPETVSLTSVEIVGAQLTTLRAHAEVSGYPGLQQLLSDPRIRHVTGDGRAFILRSPREFDIIEMDALRPTSAYSGNLYSREYFDLLRRRLAPGGLAVTWSPSRRIRDTLASVFPHVLVFDDIAIGSSEPIAYDPAVVAARAEAVRDYFFTAGINLPELLQPYLTTPPLRLDPDSPRTHHDLNTDMFPRDEFARPSRTQ